MLDYRLMPLTALIWRAEGQGPFAVLRGTVTFAQDAQTLVFRGGLMDRIVFKRKG